MFYSKAIVWNEIFLVPLILAINIDAADLLSLEKFKSFSKMENFKSKNWKVTSLSNQFLSKLNLNICWIFDSKI